MAGEVLAILCYFQFHLSFVCFVLVLVLGHVITFDHLGVYRTIYGLGKCSSRHSRLLLSPINGMIYITASRVIIF